MSQIQMFFSVPNAVMDADQRKSNDWRSFSTDRREINDDHEDRVQMRVVTGES